MNTYVITVGLFGSTYIEVLDMDTDLLIECLCCMPLADNLQDGAQKPP